MSDGRSFTWGIVASFAAQGVSGMLFLGLDTFAGLAGLPLLVLVLGSSVLTAVGIFTLLMEDGANCGTFAAGYIVANIVTNVGTQIMGISITELYGL